MRTPELVVKWAWHHGVVASVNYKNVEDRFRENSNPAPNRHSGVEGVFVLMMSRGVVYQTVLTPFDQRVPYN